MAKIEFPKSLRELLEESDLQAPIRALADRVGEILADNKLPFFPDYTDHGVEHINCVLKSEVELVPKPIWKDSKKDSDPRLLCDADAVVIIGATLLHDIAMHLRPNGFLELVGKESRFQPLPWFKDDQEGNVANIAWQLLWGDYAREARRFSDRQLTNIIGEQSARVWKFEDLPEDTGQWETNHFLIIGEFIRRHHARLAHEIAIYGFPGLTVGSGEGQFPAMGKEQGHPLMRLADLIGLSARSHGMSLRVCKAYLDSSPLYPGTPKPMGSAVLYPMALLRVADYLQIDQQRAPAALMQLRDPQSPVSIQEWRKHRAVQQISPASDPRGKMVTVGTDISLSLYLQLRDLLSGLQAEMDHSTAVLDEAYGARTDLGLDQLNLAIRRVYSNLHSPAFRDSLPYIPNRTGYTADPNLLTLLVEPLYGKEPGVGVRELMQNAVDAVRELHAWCKNHKVAIESLDLPEQEGDVSIDFIKREDGSWYLRVRDRGIGMRADTIQNHFLRAGASFRSNSEWAKEFLDDSGKPRVMRSGRFGIGAFAVFLLGASFKLWTRHVGADKSTGNMLEASANSQLIEIRRVDDLPIGTTIEVEVSSESMNALGLEREKYFPFAGPREQIDWYCWDWPKVINRVLRGTNLEKLDQEFVFPVRSNNLPKEYAVIYPDGFDAIFWTFEKYPALSCNGLKIEKRGSYSHTDFDWPGYIQTIRPNIAVLDSAGNLPLTTQRYQLSQKAVPFIDELARDVLLSVIAYGLICGPTSRDEALSCKYRHPLHKDPVSIYEFGQKKDSLFAEGLLRWCATKAAMVPVDPWLYSLLNADSYLLFGSLNSVNSLAGRQLSASTSLFEPINETGHAVLPWMGTINIESDEDWLDKTRFWVFNFFNTLASEGIVALGTATAIRLVAVESQKGLFKLGKTGRFAPMVYGLFEETVTWKTTSWPGGRSLIELQTGTSDSNVQLQPILEMIEEVLEANREDVDAVFVAEIKTTSANSPESLIAKIWNECLGPTAIPFDPIAREALIARGYQHPELKRHIEALQEMKDTGSKWVSYTGNHHWRR
ncbi:HD domain-containing protein [Methylomonas sp. 11b]|uniref:HD domain-containing protein n=1 Tax=Methylomonas sp. 11b TaxID=1168169 RepID=UPI00047AA106|nr:ATP-binding protein [Methylomonas sp. 11b]